MKLLFDQNLSRDLCNRLSDVTETATHTSFCGLQESDDTVVWEFCKQNGYSIVTKDGDFSILSERYGFPPKIILLRIGNTTTREVEQYFRSQLSLISDFITNETQSILIL